jgi:hypothetical protein
MDYKIIIRLIDNPEYEKEIGDIEELLKQNGDVFDCEIPCYGNVRNNYKNNANLYLPDYKIINLRSTFLRYNQYEMVIQNDIFFGRMNVCYDLLKEKIFIYGTYDSKIIDIYQMHYYIKSNIYDDKYFKLPSNWMIFQSDNSLTDQTLSNYCLQMTSTIPTLYKIVCQSKLLTNNPEFIFIQNYFNHYMPNVTIKNIFVMQNIEAYTNYKNFEVLLHRRNRIYNTVKMFQVSNTYYFTYSVELANIHAHQDNHGNKYINICEILFKDEPLLSNNSKYLVMNNTIPMFIVHHKNQLYYTYTIMYK